MLLRDQIIAGLLARGSVEVRSTSGKYRQFTRSEQGEKDTFYFVGRAGALRQGTCASKSRSVPDVNRDKIIASAVIPVAFESAVADAAAEKVAIAPNMDIERFNVAEAAMREDDYQCYMLLNDLHRRGALIRLHNELIRDARDDEDEIERLKEQFAEIEDRLKQRLQHQEEMLAAVAGQ